MFEYLSYILRKLQEAVSHKCELLKDCKAGVEKLKPALNPPKAVDDVSLIANNNIWNYYKDRQIILLINKYVQKFDRKGKRYLDKVYVIYKRESTRMIGNLPVEF